MENLFIPYEQALILKEFGFDEPCFRFKNNISNIVEEKGWLNWNEVEKFVSLPLYQQAFKFFREKYNIDCYIRGRKSMSYEFIISGIAIPNSSGKNTKNSDFVYETYEQAELECLKKLIEIVNK
jgi:hypothetical protein